MYSRGGSLGCSVCPVSTGHCPLPHCLAKQCSAKHCKTLHSPMSTDICLIHFTRPIDACIISPEQCALELHTRFKAISEQCWTWCCTRRPFVQGGVFSASHIKYQVHKGHTPNTYKTRGHKEVYLVIKTSHTIRCVQCKEVFSQTDNTQIKCPAVTLAQF